MPSRLLLDQPALLDQVPYKLSCVHSHSRSRRRALGSSCQSTRSPSISMSFGLTGQCDLTPNANHISNHTSNHTEKMKFRCLDVGSLGWKKSDGLWMYALIQKQIHRGWKHMENTMRFRSD